MTFPAPVLKDSIIKLLERIDQKKIILDQNRPLPPSVLERLKNDLSIEWTYNSNGIEGNSLTLVETKIVAEHGITIGGKSLREHFEVINHENAIRYITSLVSDNYSIRAIDVLKIHEMVMKNIDDSFAGRIRNGAVKIIGANFVPPAPNKVSDLLDDLIHFTNVNRDGLHPLILAVVLHHKLVWIHPFFDGNGRTSRLAMNLLLMKAGFPPSIILKNDRTKYYSALNQANKGDYHKLALLILQGLERSLNIYLNVLPEHSKEYDHLSNLAKDPEIPYGTEYLSLLARRGKINAHKEGRNWISSKEDIDAYTKTLASN